MDKQREEFNFWFGISKYTQVILPTDSNRQIAWDGWQAAHAAIQLEIDRLKQYQQNSAIMCNELTEQLNAANQRIAELEKDYAVWREYTGKVNDRNIELEERIRVASKQ